MARREPVLTCQAPRSQERKSPAHPHRHSLSLVERALAAPTSPSSGGSKSRNYSGVVRRLPLPEFAPLEGVYEPDYEPDYDYESPYP